MPHHSALATLPSDDGALLSVSMQCSSSKLAANRQEIQEHEQEVERRALQEVHSANTRGVEQHEEKRSRPGQVANADAQACAASGGGTPQQVTNGAASCMHRYTI